MLPFNFEDNLPLKFGSLNIRKVYRSKHTHAYQCIPEITDSKCDELCDKAKDYSQSKVGP